MSFRIGKTIVIKGMDNAECELCHKIDEVRPYGPKGKAICYDCGSATPEMKRIVEHNMNIQLFGEPGELL